MMNGIDDNILALIGKTPNSIITSIATRVRQRRLEFNWTQKLLASRAGMPLATYRRFESTGEVSLRGLAMIGIALETEDDFEQLFGSPIFQNIDDLLSINSAKERKRGTKDE